VGERLEDHEVKTNILGKTGLRVSVLGLGGHECRWLHAGNIKDSRHVRFNPERLGVVKRALDAGVNLFDTTFQEEVESLGHILGKVGWPEDVVVNGMALGTLSRTVGMSAEQRKRYVQEELDIRLQLLGRDYFDIFMLCGINRRYDRDRAYEMVDIYKREQAKGKFRFLGVSCHTHEELTDFLRTNPPIDVVMFPYNYGTAHNTGGMFAGYPEMLELIAGQDLGMIAIKPLCWTLYGVPFSVFCSQEHDVQELVRHNFSWQCTKGAAHATFVGVESVEELGSALAGAEMTCNEKLLELHASNYHQSSLVFANAPKHSREIGARIVAALKDHLGVDLGEDLSAYKEYIGKQRPEFTIPATRIT
jgi:predicted aldo/keto reductase-like oxidoreductase